MSVLSVDAGTRHCGVAQWDDQGVLQEASLISNITKNWWTMAKSVGNCVLCFMVIEEPSVLAIEQMQVYRRGGAPASSLLQVQGVVGGIAAVFDCDTQLYLPREWKGTAPKERTIQRIQDALTEEELENVFLPSAKSLSHNVWDGIGVGLHYFSEKGLREW